MFSDFTENCFAPVDSDIYGKHSTGINNHSSLASVNQDTNGHDIIA